MPDASGSDPLPRREAPRNVYGERLSECCSKPLTGFFRDGSCNTGSGLHRNPCADYSAPAAGSILKVTFRDRGKVTSRFGCSRP